MGCQSLLSGDSRERERGKNERKVFLILFVEFMKKMIVVEKLTTSLTYIGDMVSLDQ